MGGLVGVIANDSGRFSLFTSCMLELEIPPGWTRRMLIGGDWCGARNTLCEEVLEKDYSHLWFMDDDHAFPAAMLNRLLSHDLPLVTPICLTRVFPFSPVQYTEKTGPNQYLPVPLSKSDTGGLVEIQAGGCAGMLIRRDVIEAIEPPWFEYTDRSEDIIFCEKAKAAGFDLYADLSCRLGHITTAVVWPAVEDGAWRTGLTIGRDLNLVVQTAEEIIGEESTIVDSGDRIWKWMLKRVLTEEVVYVALVPEWQKVDYDPLPERVPLGLLQWWVDENDGTAPHPVGDSFYYKNEEGE